MADDAAAVYVPVGGRYRLVAEVQWQDPDFVPALSEALVQKGKGRPVKILYDMVEQYYRREMVPKVAIFDQAMVLDRRLAAAFPSYVMRRALPLKVEKKNNKNQDAAPAKKSDKDTAGLDGLPYLFAALPETDLMVMVVAAIKESMTYVQGLYLLPIESVGLVETLSASLNAKQTPDPNRWIVFLSQHRGGGLRQIVVKNGELSLTRLTSVIDTAVEHNAWATQVAQEFAATMGYVSRFGYTSESPLEVIAIGHPDAVSHLEGLIKTTQFYGLRLAQACQSARLPIPVSEHANLSELLHVTWIAKKLKYALPFQNKELSYISNARLIGKAVSRVLLLAMIGTLGFSGQQVIDLYNLSNEVESQKERQVKVELEYKTLLDEIERSNVNVQLVQGAIVVYQGLEKREFDLLALLSKVRTALTDELSLDSFETKFETAKQATDNLMSVETIETQRLFAKLSLSFPTQKKPEQGNLIISQFRDRLVAGFPGYEVKIESGIIDLTRDAEITIRPGERKTGGDALQKAVLTLRELEPKT